MTAYNPEHKFNEGKSLESALYTREWVDNLGTNRQCFCYIRLEGPGLRLGPVVLAGCTASWDLWNYCTFCDLHCKSFPHHQLRCFGNTGEGPIEGWFVVPHYLRYRSA